MGYCNIPFEKIVIISGGDVFLCCPSWLQHPIGNIFAEQDFTKIWNSTEAQVIRSSMINETYKFCSREFCPYLVKDIFKPRENADISVANGALNPEMTVLTQGPVIMTIDYDYTCNLLCAFCRSHVITISREKSDFLLKFQADLIESPLFQGIRELVIAGQGEVFASNIYLSFLKSIDEKRFPNLKITLLTNGNLLIPKNWEKISNAHYAITNIKISIDAATKETYEKIRLGGNFDAVLSNLKFLSGLKKNRPLQLHASFVIQKKNYREMPAFVALMKEHDVDNIFFSKLIDFNTLTKEEFLQADIHNENHPEYGTFLEVLNNPLLKTREVSLNLNIPGWNRNSVNDCSNKLPTDSSPASLTGIVYNYGEVLTFNRENGNGFRYFSRGLINNESQGTFTWTSEPVVTMKIQFPPAKSDIYLRIKAIPFTPTILGNNQYVKIYCNGAEIKRWDLKKQVFQEYKARIPVHLIKNEAPTQIEFRFSERKSPKELGMSSDTRLVGLGLDRMGFDIR